MRQGQARSLPREWLLTNAAGGSASGPAFGPPSRRAHAWLHAADASGAVTTVLIGFDEQLTAQGIMYELSPLPGHEREEAAQSADLEDFAADPWPTWRLRCGDLTIERSLFLIRGHQAVAVSYRHLSGPRARLRLSPRVVARDPDGIQRETPEMKGVAHGIPGRVRIETVPGRPTLTLWHNGAFLPARMWRRAIEHPGEDAGRPEREGKGHIAQGEREDAFIPGYVECPLPEGAVVRVVASTEEGLFRTLAIEGQLGAPPPSTLSECVDALAQAALARRRASNAGLLLGADATARQAAAAHGDDGATRRDLPLLEARDRWTIRLARAMEHGLASRAGRVAVLSEFPSGREMTEDALRSVPGLIATRSFDAAREVLAGALAYLDDGLVPSGFDAAGEPVFEGAAPALWLLHAAELLARRSEDLDWARAVFPQLESIAQYLRAGNRHGFRVGQDGLLEACDPRPAKPAALNALWYHGLVAMAQLARATGRKESAAFSLAWARQHGQCFHETFWDEEGGCLYESIEDGVPTPGLSPAQLLAVSLPPMLLSPERAARLLDRVEAELFTPLGLRPAPGVPRVETGWLGSFFSAVYRVRGRGPETQAQVRAWLELLRERLDATTIDYVPAAFEPPAGRKSRKAASDQDWLPRGVSTVAAADLLRVWIEEVEHAEQPAGSM